MYCELAHTGNQEEPSNHSQNAKSGFISLPH